MRAKDNNPACDLTINSTSDHYENIRAKREELSAFLLCILWGGTQ